MAMTKLRSVAGPPGHANSEDLRARVHFCAETGQIWLHEHRMLLVHAEAQAALRKELIDTLGMERARGLLTRMGYASGVRDAELARTRAEDSSDLEAFMTGPQLHTLEGIVRVTPIKLELNRHAGSFTPNSSGSIPGKGQWHRHHYGIHSEPVCWTQIGYACGYTSAFMGRTILYKEVECTGMGHNNCRIVGKPAEEWDDAAEQMRYFNGQSIADQLIDLQTQVVQLRSSIGDRDQMPEDVTGASPGFRAAYDLLKQAAGSHISVLLRGETGVGKEVFARSLHEMSSRSGKSFIAVNCAAIPHELVESELFGVEKGAYTGALVSRPGRFERADGGTLFLDEIGDLPASAQAKLLRVLQEGEIERLGDQKTRKINVAWWPRPTPTCRIWSRRGASAPTCSTGSMPTRSSYRRLRERKQDIPLLAKHFLAKHSAIHGKKLRGFTDKAKRALLSYAWPGNIRELQNAVERGVILAPSGTRIEVSHLFMSCSDMQSPEFGLDHAGGLDVNCWETGKDLREAVFNGALTLDQVEAMLLETAVDKARGNLSSAARMLGITRPQLAYRLKRLHEGKEQPVDPALDSFEPAANSPI
jgi:DNA-binding NtrC family response regulator